MENYSLGEKLGLFVSSLVGTFEGPPYRVLKQHEDGLEEREYEGGKKWVCTKRRNDDDESSQFFRLFNYISGKNASNTKIAMTVPVSSHVSYDGEMKRVHEMAFYLPNAFQTEPPEPTDPDVFLMTREKMEIVTRRFGGYAKERTWEQEAKDLKEKIAAKGIHVHEHFHYENGYDAPSKFLNRRNELWFVKKEQQQ